MKTKLIAIWRYLKASSKCKSIRKMQERLDKELDNREQAQAAVVYFIKKKRAQGAHLNHLAIKNLVERQFKEQLEQDGLRLKWSKSGIPLVAHA